MFIIPQSRSGDVPDEARFQPRQQWPGTRVLRYNEYKDRLPGGQP
jgi:hypothetical protein